MSETAKNTAPREQGAVGKEKKKLEKRLNTSFPKGQLFTDLTFETIHQIAEKRKER